jgi:hypothetical protein
MTSTRTCLVRLVSTTATVVAACSSDAEDRTGDVQVDAADVEAGAADASSDSTSTGEPGYDAAGDAADAADVDPWECEESRMFWAGMEWCPCDGSIYACCQWNNQPGLTAYCEGGVWNVLLESDCDVDPWFATFDVCPWMDFDF